MGGTNKKTRDKNYKRILKRGDPEVCRSCKTPATEKELVVHHINNNYQDNRLENLCFLCRRCNYLSNPRKKPVDSVCVSVCEDWAEHSELKENRRMEPLFRQWVMKKMMEKNPRRLDYIINAGAENIGASTETTKRYIRKMSSDEGDYAIIRDSMNYQYLHFRKNNISRNEK